MNSVIRVLLVDDEEQFVLNMVRILEIRGFDVKYAFNGRDAVEAVRHGGRFDVVVLDVKMPGMDGIQTLEEIKKCAPHTEVIMLTGHATVTSGIQAMRKGAYDYLMKPCDMEDLVEKIKEAYQAETIKRHPVLWPRKMIREIPLHRLHRLGPEDPLKSALEVMGWENVEGVVEEVYIVDGEDRLMGVVNRRTLLDEAVKFQGRRPVTWETLLENPHWLPDKILGRIMTPDPVATQTNSLLTDAAQQMIMHKIRSMPVLRAEKVIGIIRMQDVFQYVDHEIEQG